MKVEFIEALSALAERDPAVWLLTGDLGFGAFETFKEQFPTRFLNCGIAEQNMVGFAAGAASEGVRPAVYSIGNFLVFRAAEQIRNDIVAPQHPVLLVAAGAGFTYGAAGYSHHLTEDLAFMRSLPGLTVFTPSTASDLAPMIEEWGSRPRPTYLRLERGSTYGGSGDPAFEVGSWRTLRRGADGLICALGSTVTEAITAAGRLDQEGFYASVVDCNQLTGLSPDYLDQVLGSADLVVSVEEHSTRGGLSSLIAEEIATRGMATRLLTLGVDRQYSELTGSPEYLRSHHAISADSIVQAILGTVPHG